MRGHRASDSLGRMIEAITPRTLAKSALAYVLGALLLMYALCVVMWVARVQNSGETTYFFVAGNLTLAWMPMVFASLALLASERRTPGSLALTGALCTLWLLFFPNAPYVVTDLQHYEDSPLIAGWYDGLMLGAYVAAGVLLGLLSLYVVQGVVAQVAGAAWSWAMVFVAIPLCGFGIYVGRELRWNSWDAIVAPGKIIGDLAWVATNAPMRLEAIAVTIGFSAFVMTSYIVLMTLTALGATRSQG